MDYKDLANLIFPDAKPIEFYEEKYPERDLPEGAMVVRIGPSPTGSVHIGTIYQALLARTIADKTNGVFFMRVEDTDQKREVENGIKDIIDSLKYFDVLPDEGMDTETTWHGEYGPYRQSMRKEIYQAYAKYLLEQGKAYPCFATAEELEEMRSLVSLGARMGFYLISFFAIPILIKTEQILTLWLGEYPQYTIIFVRLTLILSMLESFGPTLAAAQAATGKIRNYHITISSIGLLNLPISILLLHWNYPPYIPYIVSISLMIIINGIRLYFLKKSIKIKVGKFITSIYLRGAVVVLTGTTIPLLIHKYYTNLHIIGLGIYMLLCFLSMGIAIFLVGLSSNERSIIIQKITRTIIKDKR